LIIFFLIDRDNEELSLAFNAEEEKRILLEKDNISLQQKYEKTMEELKETYNFLISINEEFGVVEKEAQELKDAKELHTHIFKITQTVKD
jgi:hypothetical protein